MLRVNLQITRHITERGCDRNGEGVVMMASPMVSLGGKVKADSGILSAGRYLCHGARGLHVLLSTGMVND